MHGSWQTQPVDQSQEAQMCGCDNKMTDDYWKGEKQGNQRGPIHPKKHKEGAEAVPGEPGTELRPSGGSF